MALTAAAIRAAKPGAKSRKLFDGGGLYLLITPTGAKGWRFKYRFAGREKLLSFGSYPDISLRAARDKRDAARNQLGQGIDPSAARKAAKASGANTFEAVAREWFEKQSPKWVNLHASTIIRRLELNVFPWIGKQAVNTITAPELLSVLRRVEGRGAVESAHRILQSCGQVFRYAIATERADRDPAADLRGALAPVDSKHFAAITDPKSVAGLLRAIDGYTGSFVVKAALRLAPLVFVRPGELRKAQWHELDLEAAEWNIPAKRMKTKQAHLVPLSQQAVLILRELQPLTGSGQFVFPSARSHRRPISDNAVLAALRRMGIAKEEMTGHGFRAMARTILDEVLNVRPDIIEHQLGHAVRDPNGRAYNRTKFLPERRAMVQQWADYLDSLKAGTTIVSRSVA
jgi:integrase